MSVVLNDGARVFLADEEIMPRKRRMGDDYAYPAVIVLATSQPVPSVWLLGRGNVDNELPIRRLPALAEWGIWWANIYRY